MQEIIATTPRWTSEEQPMRDRIVRSLVAGVAALAFMIPAFGGSVYAAAVPPVDNSIYAELLTKYVVNGHVDYAGFKRDEARLDQYLKVLEQVDPERLPREEQFAFYINAYNAWTIKLILTGYPGVKSIKDLGSLLQSPWKKSSCASTPRPSRWTTSSTPSCGRASRTRACTSPSSAPRKAARHSSPSRISERFWMPS
ncbi:MAG: DUF547 domain-containing protein [Desulfobacterales bacterium]|nr:DUF547 domain-containing protein [Desulfobacterales bacterium]